MKILHVITTLDPNYGGPPAVALRLAAAQAAQGHHVEIASYEAAEAAARIAKSLEPIPGISRVKLPVVKGGGLAEHVLGGAAARYVRSRAREFDGLHLHGVWDTIVRVAAREARRAGVKYAVTPHGVLDPWCLASTPVKKVKKKVALAVAYRRMLNGAAFLHTLNRDERDLMAPLGLRPRAEVVPNGVFIEEFASLPARGVFTGGHPEFEGRKYILFLSRLHYKKGLDILADGFSQVAGEMPGLVLVVAGPDDGALSPLMSRVKALGLEGRVFAVGPLYGAEKMAALVGAEAFCLTSRQEGFSMAVTEAMACRVPVVISDQCHFPEVEEVGAGRVTTLQPASVAAAIREVLVDESRRRAMGEAGRALVESRFTWPRIAAAIVEAFGR